ncbi:BPSL0761 family protein [Pseudoxanthomonas japonensis]|uniref:BPSL0761 family protein n=1 Tax=Pseudoxanthomonas japonensis TaxID=69284 RepID=UPI003748A427
MPVERTRNLIQAGAFLRDLSANQHVPREIRTEAYRLLRHFPSVSDRRPPAFSSGAI